MNPFNCMLALTCAGSLVAFIYSRRNKSKVSRGPTQSIDEVLFFPDKEFPCNISIKELQVFPATSRKRCHNPSCRKLHNRDGESQSSLLKFLTILADAKDTVDICIYIFTQPTLANILKNLVTAGKQVRVITDGSEDEGLSSQVESLREYGIIIKSNKRETGALMHHKFVIIDGTILLTGSFNWTNKAVISNYEAVLITSNKTLVDPFKNIFEEMWSNFSMHPRSKRL